MAAMLVQEELLKTQFEVIAKAKASNFRNNCLLRADKLGIDRANVPMPKDFYNWLITYQDKLEIHRKRFYLQCEYTGERIKLNDIQIDHRTPIGRGGSFQVYNLAITTAQSNQRKGILTELEFKQLLEFLNGFEPVAKSDVLARLRKGAVNRKF